MSQGEKEGGSEKQTVFRVWRTLWVVGRHGRVWSRTVTILDFRERATLLLWATDGSGASAEEETPLRRLPVWEGQTTSQTASSVSSAALCLGRYLRRDELGLLRD